MQIPLGVARRFIGCVLAVAGATGAIVGALALRFGDHPGLVRHFGQHQLTGGVACIFSMGALVAGCYLAGRLAVAVTGALTMLAGVAMFVIGMCSDNPHFDLFPLLAALVVAVGMMLFGAGIAEKLKGRKGGW
jgi:peptidoglycan/LPS O-acetylase OafA/YrhL